MIERLIDAHHHLWDLSEGRYPWLRPPAPGMAPDDLASLREPYPASAFLADVGRAPLRGSVHVEAAFDPTDPVAETRWLAGQVQAWRVPTVAVAAARLQAPELDRILAGHLEYGFIRGVRQMLNWTPQEPVAERDGLLTDPAWRAGLTRLSPLGLSFDLQVFPHQLPLAAEVATVNPELTIVLDHGGFCQRATPERVAAWRSGLRLLARHPNVSVKASSYASVDPTFAPDGLTRYVGELFDVFGAGRVMFGSNFPVDRRHVSYQKLLAQYDHTLTGYSASERAGFFYANAARAYRLHSS